MTHGWRPHSEQPWNSFQHRWLASDDSASSRDVLLREWAALPFACTNESAPPKPAAPETRWTYSICAMREEGVDATAVATAAEVIEQGVMCLDDTAVGAGATANLCAPRWTPLRPRTLRSDAFFTFGNRVWPR